MLMLSRLLVITREGEPMNVRRRGRGWVQRAAVGLATLVVCVPAACDSPDDEKRDVSPEGGDGSGATGGEVRGGGAPGGDARGGDATGDVGGATSPGAAGENAGLGGADASGGAGESAAGVSGTVKGVDRGLLLGPASPDEPLVVVAKEYQLPNSCPGNQQGSEVALSDSRANVYFRFSCGLIQFDEKLTKGWMIGGPANNFTAVTTASIAESDDVYVGGTLTGAAVVAKFDSEGTELWRASWSSSGEEYPTALVIGSDNALYATGPCSGQAPGNPATAKGGRWLARYDAESGATAWLKQYAGESPNLAAGAGQQALAIDVEKNLYITGSFGLTALRKLDQDGLLLWDRSRQDLLSKYHLGDQLRDIRPSPDGQSFYAWTHTPEYLVNLSIDGDVNWFRKVEMHQEAVIDAVEGTIWRGDVAAHAYQFAVSGDAIYVVGVYDNSYMNGANPPPATVALLVARYDLLGERVWFKQFSLEGTQPDRLGWRTGVVEDSNGNIAIAANDTIDSKAPFVFRLKAEDGSLLHL